MDLWPLYRSARAEAKELDAAARAALKCHSSCHYNKHGELLRAEYKRLVQLWKEKQRQATNLLEEVHFQLSMERFHCMSSSILFSLYNAVLPYLRPEIWFLDSTQTLYP